MNDGTDVAHDVLQADLSVVLEPHQWRAINIRSCLGQLLVQYNVERRAQPAERHDVTCKAASHGMRAIILLTHQSIA